MKATLSKIWTRFAVIFSYDDNCYRMSASINNCYFMGVLLPEFVHNSTQHPCVFYVSHFFLQTFRLRVQAVQPYSSTDNTSLWMNSCFVLSEISDFQLVDNLSVAVYAFPMCMLMSLSVDEILLPRYMNWSTNFKFLTFDKKRLHIYAI